MEWWKVKSCKKLKVKKEYDKVKSQKGEVNGHKEVKKAMLKVNKMNSQKGDVKRRS